MFTMKKKSMSFQMVFLCVSDNIIPLVFKKRRKKKPVQFCYKDNLKISTWKVNKQTEL